MSINPCWIDRLGDRLDHPERVAPEFQHLIPDDQQRVKRLLEIPVKGRVLEVGCSDGAMTRRIAALPGVIVYGVDKIQWDIREEAPSALFPGARPFDAIYCCEVLEHLTFEDAKRAMTNLTTILKPGGTLILSVPNQQPALHYVAGCRDRWKWPDHRSWWLPYRLIDLLEERSNIGELQWYPLYPDVETSQDSIWLIVSGIKG